MAKILTNPDETTRGEQAEEWQRTFLERKDMFGPEPSESALYSSALFKSEGKTKLLEMGSGQGRDTLHFAHDGLQVTALDYSPAGLEQIVQSACREHVAHRITLVLHDVRNALPFESDSFDCCYSHMLYCMALRRAELAALSREVLRVLRPGGLHVFTTRCFPSAKSGPLMAFC